MNISLLLFMVFCTRAELFDSGKLRSESSPSDENFEEELEEGYQSLKGEPNADDTKRLLQQLHKMGAEIKQEFTIAPEREVELQEAMENYAGIRMEEIGVSIEEINAKSKINRALFQGDMVLTKEQAEKVLEDVKESEAKRRKRQAYRDKWYPKTLWSDGVYYAFYSNATDAAKRVFRKAALFWQNLTCIKFTEDRNASNKILVIKEVGCWSHVGRTGGTQGLSLGKGCETIGTAAHEIAHALGFFHMQSRYDRDDFIKLHWENFKADWATQFSKETNHTNYNYNLTYDYGGVMHYGATGVSKNGRPVMVPYDTKYLQTLGSPMVSFYEILMMNLHYKCLDKCTESSSAKCQNGGFSHPRNCSICICPSGYGGNLCNERPSGCGKILTATNSYRILEDVVGERGLLYGKDEFQMCNYWIKGPVGSKIEVVLVSYTDRVATDGCRLAGVEIKAGSDKRLTGYRFCSSKYAGTTLVSTHNIVPIITYSRIFETKTVLFYRIASTSTTSTPTTVSTTTSQPTTTPDHRCKDNILCAVILKLGFCTHSKYDDKLRKKVCPKSCGFC